jgi:hypothetical protein
MAGLTRLRLKPDYSGGYENEFILNGTDFARVITIASAALSGKGNAAFRSKNRSVL